MSFRRSRNKAPEPVRGARRHAPVAPPPRFAGNQWRVAIVLGGMLLVVVALLSRALWLQLLDAEFLESQADQRHQRSVPLAAHRGMMLDRRGEPLAVSVPVDSIWVDPRHFDYSPAADEVINGETGEVEKNAKPDYVEELAAVMGLRLSDLRKKLETRKNSRFVWLRRRMEPDVAQYIVDAEIPGVYRRREYRRFYPSGEVNGHALGYTDIDDHGQEGLEKAYDDWLRGEPGKARVMKDRGGRSIAELEGYVPPRQGKNLQLTLDRRIQFLAYRALKRTVKAHDAKGGTVVLVDVPSGGILALANQPAFNPNDRSQLPLDGLRNRSLTDVFEPGSTIKPFVIATALDNGYYQSDSEIDTSPGWMMIGRKRVKDHRNYGVLDMTGILRKSSNMGASKVAMSMPRDTLWGAYNQLGFGHLTATNFPGETAGRLPHFGDWSDIGHATLSYGYGLSVTAVQLAQAYTVLAAGGRMRELTFVEGDARYAGGEKQVFTPETADVVLSMLESVVKSGGTGRRADIAGYRVAGKTGTAHKVAATGGYDRDRYMAVFAGIAPASSPRVVAICLIDEPGKSQVYGGQVAAPLFHDVVSGALRLLNVRPDNLPQTAPPAPLVPVNAVPVNSTPVDSTPGDATIDEPVEPIDSPADPVVPTAPVQSVESADDFQPTERSSAFARNGEAG